MSHPHDTTSGGRALRCDEARVLLMGHIDGEISDGDRGRLEDHLAVCVECRSEERAYRQLGKVTAAALRHPATTADAGVAWMRIYERLESGLAYALLWIGISMLSLYGLWQMASEYLRDPAVPVVVRFATGFLTAGALLLLISFIRDRLRRYRSERYGEVQR